jgi:hypothetical protein
MLAAPAFWYRSALVALLISLAMLLPLGRLLPPGIFRSNRRAVLMGASIFWLGFSLLITRVAWSGYYRYFYPAWMSWGVLLLAVIVFPGLAFAFHWLACRLPGHPLGWFCLFAGLEAVLEHAIAWAGLDLPARVPLLAGASLGPILVFAFFEYQIYWAVALWIAWWLTRLKLKKNA